MRALSPTRWMSDIFQYIKNNRRGGCPHPPVSVYFVRYCVYARDDEGIVPYWIKLRIRHPRDDESVIPTR